MRAYEVAGSKELKELSMLCKEVRNLVASGEYDACRGLICQAMQNYPDAPQPHNLLGVVLEKGGDHALAMKHFRAASALDPTYGPASQNLMLYGTFYTLGREAYDESDCREDREPSGGRIEYGRNGVGHFVRGR